MENLDILNNRYIEVKVIDENSTSSFLSCVKPEKLILYPRYINSNNNICFGGLSHYQCDINRDVINILQIMNRKVYDYDEKVSRLNKDVCRIHFWIKDRIIYFDNEFYLKVNSIKMMLKEKYGVTDFKTFISDDSNILDFEYKEINLHPKEYFEMYYLRMIEELTRYKDNKKLQVKDVRKWLNCLKTQECCSWENMFRDNIFSEEIMWTINNLLDTKRQIYSEFYKLVIQSEDLRHTIESLLKCMERFPNIVEKPAFRPFVDSRDNTNDEWEKAYIEASMDLLIQFVGLDKIETNVSRKITTSLPDANLRYKDLILDGYEILQIPHLHFDDKSQEFIFIDPVDFKNSSMDREVEEEIKLIKKQKI